MLLDAANRRRLALHLVLLAPHAIDRFVEHFSDVKLVVYNDHVRNLLCGGRRKAGTHIHRRRFDVFTLRLGHALPECAAALGIIAGHDLQNAALVQIGQHRDIVLA